MVGAYIQLFRNDGKGELMLYNFRKHYPESKIYLVSDKGDDFSSVAERYNCSYSYGDINTGVRNNGFTKGELLVWLKRFYNCFNYCTEDYILYMEDDVYVRGKINIDENYAIAGVKVGSLIPDQVFDYLKCKPTEGGACGGTIYNRKIFLDKYDEIVEFVNLHFDELYKIYINIGCLDQFMPIVYNYLGYKYGLNKEIVETGRNANWRHTNHSIVHINNYDEREIIKEIKNGSG